MQLGKCIVNLSEAIGLCDMSSLEVQRVKKSEAREVYK